MESRLRLGLLELLWYELDSSCVVLDICLVGQVHAVRRLGFLGLLGLPEYHFSFTLRGCILLVWRALIRLQGRLGLAHPTRIDLQLLDQSRISLPEVLDHEDCLLPAHPVCELNRLLRQIFIQVSVDLRYCCVFKLLIGHAHCILA